MKQLFFLFLLRAFAPVYAQQPPLHKADTLELRLSDPASFADINWGTVKQGGRLLYYFKLVNDLPEAIVLNRISTGDGGCYVDSIGKGLAWELPVPAGKTVTFQLLQMTEGREGALSKTIFFRFSDAKGELPSRQFLFRGTVVRP